MSRAPVGSEVTWQEGGGSYLNIEIPDVSLSTCYLVTSVWISEVSLVISLPQTLYLPLSISSVFSSPHVWAGELIHPPGLPNSSLSARL